MKDGTLLTENAFDAIAETLARMGIDDHGHRIASVSKAGEGNMNLVLRIVFDSNRSVVLKQSRPWVEKYPTIAAPEERILAEIAFYETVSGVADVAAGLPKIIARDAEARIMVLEDLGSATDYTSLYAGDQNDADDAFASAARWLGKLHAIDVGNNAAGDHIQCYPLRELNHQHIFIIPMMEPAAIDLDAVCGGLANATKPLRQEIVLKTAMEKLGTNYLRGGGTLLHGDFYPGSWLKSDQGFRVIDPEFCFLGPREFDVGVWMAHRLFCGEEWTVAFPKFRRAYGDAPLDRGLAMRFAGCEIIRRLLGVAQLPLRVSVECRQRWLMQGRRLVLG